MKRLILASKSPRRKELMARMGFDYEVIAADIDESAISAQTPIELVKALSLAKAKHVSDLAPDCVIVAADTVVELDGRVLGKPSDTADAIEMLKELSGSAHHVHTGLCVIDGGNVIMNETSSAAVYFRELSDDEIKGYALTGEPLDKAGAYGIQELGGVFAERIDGDFYAVIGLPIVKLFTLLKSLGFKAAF